MLDPLLEIPLVLLAARLVDKKNNIAITCFISFDIICLGPSSWQASSVVPKAFAGGPVRPLPAPGLPPLPPPRQPPEPAGPPPAANPAGPKAIPVPAGPPPVASKAAPGPPLPAGLPAGLPAVPPHAGGAPEAPLPAGEAATTSKAAGDPRQPPPQLQHAAGWWPAAAVEWEQDRLDPKLYWWGDMQGGWHRFRDAPPAKTAGGWCFKTAALVHMQEQGEMDSLSWTLRRLRWHPGLRAAYGEVDQQYRSRVAAYGNFFPCQ